MINLAVEGTPTPQPRQRHRVGPRGVVMNYTPVKHKVNAYKDAIRLAASGSEYFDDETAVSVDIVFVMPRPLSMVRKTMPMPRVAHMVKPDIDNLLKAVLDALTGVCWHDDKQVVRICASKWIAAGDEHPATYITIQKAYD